MPRGENQEKVKIRLGFVGSDVFSQSSSRRGTNSVCGAFQWDWMPGNSEGNFEPSKSESIGSRQPMLVSKARGLMEGLEGASDATIIHL